MPPKKPNSVVLVLVAVACSVALMLAIDRFRPRGRYDGEAARSPAAESAYDRVLRAGTIRAAYINYPPGCTVDPSSKQISGIFVDALRQIGQNVGLKVEFTEEVGWGTMIQGLESGRYDLIGSATWANPVRGKLATLSRPVYYSGIGIWVRSDETRFPRDDDWSSINQPGVRIAAMDGSTPAVIARTQFPRAKLVTYPDLTGESQLFLELTSKKVDVFFAEPYQGMKFLASTPGSIKNLAADRPLRVFANVYVLPRNEFQLKNLIDTAIDDLENRGVIDQLLKRYEPGPNAYYRTALPYQTPAH